MNDEEYIVDTDAGVDDTIAISTLLKLNKKVAAITVVDGNTPTLIGYQNVKKLLKKYNNTSAKVYKATKPLITCDQPVPRWIGHGKDGFGGYSHSEEFKVYFHALVEESIDEPQNAVLALLALSNAKKYTLICLGPLTNIALAISIDPLFLTKFKNVFIMGASLLSQGNSSLTSEFNIHYDPEAASIVFQSSSSFPTSIPLITCVSWETTFEHAFEWSYFDEITKEWEGNTNMRFMKRILEKVEDMEREVYEEYRVKIQNRRHVFEEYIHKTNSFCPCDFFLVACIVDPSIVKEYQDCKLHVELNGTHSRGGWSGRKEYKENVRMILKMDQEKLKQLIKSVFE